MGERRAAMMAHRLLLTSDAVGGVWRYSLELASGLSEHGVAVVLAVLGPPPDAAQRREAAAVPGLSLHLTGLPLDWTATSAGEIDAAAHALACLAGRQRVDSAQLHTPALIGAATWPVPVVAAVHSCVATWWHAVRGGPLPPDLAWRASAVAGGLAAADAVFAPSESFAAALRACYRLRRRIAVIPNGRRPLAARGEKRAAVLTVGRLWDPGKGVATLDAAAASLGHPVLAAGPLAGPDGNCASFRHLRHLGNLDEAELVQAYGEAAVFASAARYEPFGLAVLEAAQAGCALLLADIPTFRELWSGAARFVPPDDVAAWTAALRGLLDDPAACRRWGSAARRHAARFDPARMAADTLALHRTVLAREAA